MSSVANTADVMITPDEMITTLQVKNLNFFYGKFQGL